MFESLGITVAVVRAGDRSTQLRAAFSADVVYITAQQLAFTYLGDNLMMDEKLIVRPLLSAPRPTLHQPADTLACLQVGVECLRRSARMCPMRQAGAQAHERACRPSRGHGTTRLWTRWTPS